MYYVDGDYKGTYSNNEDLLAVTSNEDNFGLDDYEPLFFHPLPEWIGYGEMSVFLKIDDDTDYTKDIFYFCHVSVHISYFLDHIDTRINLAYARMLFYSLRRFINS